jgi:D-aminoacyl-tRNA deacylase
MILLVHSNQDLAGKNIATHLLQQHSFHKTSQTYQQNHVFHAQINGKQVTYITLEQESIDAQNLPQDFPDAELVVFVSRHSSKSETPTLTVHTPGNFSKAEFGGLPRCVSVCPATAMADALKALNRLKVERSLDYQVSYEATHHGPSLDVPTMFVELGSCEKQWQDQNAAQAVAQSAWEAIANYGNSGQPAVLGVGGTHYNRKFTQMALSGEAVFGHMIPKYAVPEVDLQMLQQCVTKTSGQVTGVVLDWKGIKSEDKPKLLAELSELGLPISKV